MKPSAVFVAKNGSSDRLPGAFLGSLHAAAISGSFEEGVRHTLKAGGEGMSGRAMLVRSAAFTFAVAWNANKETQRAGLI